MKKDKKKKDLEEEVVNNTPDESMKDLADAINPEDVDNTKDKKRPNVIKEKFNMYKFIIKLFACAILVTFGVIILVRQTEAQFAILLITGVVAAVAALIRIIPVFKTLKDKRAKRVYLVEIAIHLVLGIYIIIAAFQFLENPDNDFAKFNTTYYHIMLAILLYTRAVAYFWVVVLYREITDKFKFWLDIILITLSVFFAALNDVTPEQIAIALACIAFVCALVVGGEAGGGYYMYRKSMAAPKEKKVKKEAEIEAPAKDSNKSIDEIDPNIIPVNDENPDKRDIIS